jgi:uncharacterized protein YndB with AHSA1/START domain
MLSSEAFRLSYRWHIEGPIQTVFHFLSQMDTYPAWWPVFLYVHSDDEDVHVGASAIARVKSFLPYHLEWKCTISRLDPPHYIEVDTHVALGGWFPLRGQVRFRLVQNGPFVTVFNEQLEWPERHIPRLLRALAARLFSFNHAYAMSLGEPGLQRVVRAATS